MKKTSANDKLKKIEVKSRTALREWLKANHSQKESIWLVHFKKSRPEHYIGYDAIVEEALCFGWIDSLPRKLDNDRTMLRLSPRKPQSAWSKANRDRVKKLIDNGLMTPIGMKIIETAKRDGSWDKLKAVDGNVIPTDLKSALGKNSRAKVNFDAFPPSTKRAILEWIEMAKTEKTRKNRIQTTVSLAVENIRAHQYQKKK